LEAGSLVLRSPSRWACAVRMAAMLDFVLRVPARSANIGCLRVDWVTYSDTDRPWAGTIRVYYPEHATKSGRDQNPYLTQEGEGTVDPDLSGFNRTLFALYIMKSGARDILLTPVRGSSPVPCDFLFVAVVATSGAKKAGTWNTIGHAWSSVSAEFGRMVRKYGKSVGLVPSEMKNGALGIHIIRHLFATFFLPTNPEYAAVMLGHASPDITRQHYAWLTHEHFRHEHELRIALERKADLSPNCTAGVVGGPECVECFEPLRVRDGVVARRCHACRAKQPQAA
jgi:hypothetical protein